MHENRNVTRVLALDLRSQRFGYAVLDESCRLLTWGIRTYRAADNNGRAILARERVSNLLVMFKPTVIAANHPSGRQIRRGPAHREIVNAIRAEGRLHSATVVLFGRDEIQRVFSALAETTKETIASEIAVRFPELAWKLPPLRKKWTSEHHNTTLFDAIAIGLTYLVVSRDESPLSSGEDAFVDG
jgi:hypothetical protein